MRLVYGNASRDLRNCGVTLVLTFPKYKLTVNPKDKTWMLSSTTRCLSKISDP